MTKLMVNGNHVTEDYINTKMRDYGLPEHMAFMRGKACNADWFAHGEPTPRLNEKGAVYGWDVMTGRMVVPLMCSYCDYKAQHCWQEAVLEIDGTKPIWVVPAQVKA